MLLPKGACRKPCLKINLFKSLNQQGVKMKKTILSLQIIFATAFIFSSYANAQMYWNQAGNFPGTVGSHITVPNSSSLDLTSGFTLEAWINPTAPAIIAKGIISKGTGLSIRYAVRMISGRVVVITNSTQRLFSRSTNLIPLHKWTHLAVTLSSTGLYQIYFNGILDTSVSLPGTLPVANTDSLYIGSTGSSTEFTGQIDEVRIWNSNLAALEIKYLMKSTLGVSGDGTFNKLVLSIPFQNNTGSGPVFSAMDHSDKLNHGFIRNVTAFDLKDRPSGMHVMSDCVNLSTAGYLSAPDNSTVSPSAKLTIECWIFPKTQNYGILYKGPVFSSNADYGLRVISGKLTGYINNIQINSADSVKTERWTHVAFTYFGATGRYEFYINGKPGTTGNITPANINNGTDSLFAGVFPLTSSLSGYIDELRITSDLKTMQDINSQMFTSVNETNDNDAAANAVYNLDGSTLPNTDGGPRMNLRGTASFTFNSAPFVAGIPHSPVLNISSGQFQSGYYLNMPQKRIPATGTSGTIKDTIEILSSETISDLNIYIAINHMREENLRLTITSPLGATTELFANTSLLDSNKNLVTIFDSDIDSALISSRYVSFGPRIKPLFDIDAIFSGSNSKGKWILSVTDEASSDTGSLISWGVQINEKSSLPFNLECTSLMEGLYNSASNTLIADTVRYFLRSNASPYSIIDSSKAKVNTSGSASVPFTKVQPETNYFLAIKHRNSIETWSSTVIKFTQFTKQTSYNFTDLVTKAFGNNMKQVDSSPVRFAVYSGDVNQDGTVDISDGSLIDNDAFNFASGYLPTDINGDEVSDLADAVFADNNGFNFVVKITP